MRLWLAIVLGLFASLARAEKIILIPLDSRPAAGQFAQMIGAIANAEVIMPPYEELGRFTNPGSPEAILAWLSRQDPKEISAVIVSTDMVAYGGLIASRVSDTPYALAIHRLKLLEQIREKWPEVRFYGFSAIMRLYPTGTKSTAAWGLSLGLYEQEKTEFHENGNRDLLAAMRNVEAKIPPREIQRYEETRKRDYDVQQDLLRMTKAGLFEYFILGQDDAQPIGPFTDETKHLRDTVDNLAIGGRVYFCEGIDQHANVLVSRALLKETDWVPRVRVMFSDPDGRTKIANFESKDIEESFWDQIYASGARPAMGSDSDYTVYLNTPGRNEDSFQSFLTSLNDSADRGDPISVADINLAKDGTADPELFQSLLQNGRMVKLLSYSGWNTAGNTMGTAIPAANVYLYAKKTRRDPLQREVAQREFLLHRFVNDYDYHKFTRPLAYSLIRATPTASKLETYGEDFRQLNAFVKRDLGAHLQTTFDQQFLGKRFSADDKEYEISGLSDIKIFLPWPRAYEVRLEFKMDTKEVASPK